MSRSRQQCFWNADKLHLLMFMAHNRTLTCVRVTHTHTHTHTQGNSNYSQKLPAHDSEQLQRAPLNPEATPNSPNVELRMAGGFEAQEGGCGGSGSGGEGGGGGGEPPCSRDVCAPQHCQSQVNEERSPEGDREGGTGSHVMTGASLESGGADPLPAAQASTH
jgi:hypothetical protein